MPVISREMISRQDSHLQRAQPQLADRANHRCGAVNRRTVDRRDDHAQDDAGDQANDDRDALGHGDSPLLFGIIDGAEAWCVRGYGDLSAAIVRVLNPRVNNRKDDHAAMDIADRCVSTSDIRA